MAWFFGLFAVALALGWWCSHRRVVSQWRRLEQILSELAEGKTPRSFVFSKCQWSALITPALDRLSQSQEQLRQAISREEFNLRMILASMEEGVMVVDAQHLLRLVNPSFRKLFDLKHDPTGQSVLRTVRETALEEMVRAALGTGEAQRAEISLTAMKPPRHLAVHAVAMREQGGGAGVVTIFRDVSRLKQLEEVRREFVANVSHELRTPLSIFRGYLETLTDEPGMSRKARAEVFEVLRKHSMRLNALLEDLLALARLESRAEAFAVEAIALKPFLLGVAEDWAVTLEKKKLTLALEIPRDLPPLFADRLRLDQVMSNLLENAVKYTNTGEIRVSARTVGEEIELRVEDPGLGIPPSDLPHIFERFYRADKARSREHGGTGLGLSIVKHIVQAHGGSVTAESKYGKGTAIILRWPPPAPASKPEPAQAQLSHAPQAPENHQQDEGKPAFARQGAAVE